MEGEQTRVSYTKEDWDEEKEMLNWKPRQREKDRMELTLRMSGCCHGNAPSKMRACMQSGFFIFLCHVPDSAVRLFQFFTHVIWI